jgi:hypothetical protein
MCSFRRRASVKRSTIFCACTASMSYGWEDSITSRTTWAGDIITAMSWLKIPASYGRLRGWRK